MVQSVTHKAGKIRLPKKIGPPRQLADFVLNQASTPKGIPPRFLGPPNLDKPEVFFFGNSPKISKGKSIGIGEI